MEEITRGLRLSRLYFRGLSDTLDRVDLSAILEHVRAKRYTQVQLVDILDEYQPSVSNLLKGRISHLSIEKLLRYADRLHLQTSIAVRPTEGRSRRVRVRETADSPRPARKLAAAS